MGFSSMVSGMMLMPLVGNWTVPPDRSYAPAYDKATEKASPGYYTVYFPEYKVKAELTTTRRTALYRFTFPKTEQAVVLLDLGAGTGSVEVAGDHTVRGRAAGGGRRGGGGGTFFVAEFSKPFAGFGTFKQNTPTVSNGRVRFDDVTTPEARTEAGDYAGSYLRFATAENEAVLVKIASGASAEEAGALLAAEDAGWDFAGVKQKAEGAWSEKLGTIEIKGGRKRNGCCFTRRCIIRSPVRGWWRRKASRSGGWTGRRGRGTTTATGSCRFGTRAGTRSYY